MNYAKALLCILSFNFCLTFGMKQDDSAILSLCINHQGEYVTIGTLGSLDGKLKTYQAATGQKIGQDCDDIAMQMHYLEGNIKIVTTDNVLTRMSLWDIQEVKKIRSFEYSNEQIASQCAVDNNNPSSIFSIGVGNSFEWNVNEKNPVTVYKYPDKKVWAVGAAASSNFYRAAAVQSGGPYDPKNQGIIYLWDTKKNDSPFQTSQTGNNVAALTFNADDSYLIGGGEIKSGVSTSYPVLLYDMKNIDNPARKLEGHTGRIFYIKADENDPATVATASLDYTVRQWDLTTGKCVATQEITNKSSIQVAINFVSHIVAMGSLGSPLEIKSLESQKK